MSVHFFCSVTWTCSLIILVSIHKSGSSSSPHTYYSETNDIIAYGASVISAIIQYPGDHGNFTNILKSIKIKYSKIQHLMDRNSSTILHLYSCQRESGLDYLNEVLQYIDREYNKFEIYLNISDRHHEFPLHVIPIHEAGFLDIYAQISLRWSNVTNPVDNPEIFEALVTRYDPMIASNCNLVQSLNQYIYDLYNKILLGLIKVYSIIIYHQVNSVVSANIDRRATIMKDIISDFETHISRVTNNALKAMQRSSRYILRRDPSIHVKGVTYDSLDYFIQGYVADQRFFRQDEACTPSCSDYNDTVYYNHADGRFFPEKSICTGHIRSCTNSPVEQIYLASPNSTRRYDGLSNIPSDGENLIYFGREPEYYGIISITRYSGFCRICACTCDMVDSPKSIRYVDLQKRESRSADSFVITGIRFRIVKRVVYLQIQEGVLKDGQILPETVTWQEIGDTDRDYDNDPYLFKLDYDNRSVDLTDLTLRSTYAIIMVAFKVKNGVISLRTQGRLINGGELIDPILHTIFNSSDPTISSRPVFQPGGLDIPILETSSNTKISEPNRFQLKFETSDWDHDAGQNVVPFIDLQDVVTDPPAPVSGIGMHVRYGDTSGGFLAPKLISINNEIKIVHDDTEKKIELLYVDVNTRVDSEKKLMNKHTSPRRGTLSSRFGPNGTMNIGKLLSDPFIPSKG